MQSLLKTTFFLLLALLLASTPALACTVEDPPVLSSFTHSQDPVDISLYDYSGDDAFSLCAIDLSYPNNTYDVMYFVEGSSGWQPFNTMFGPFMYAEFDLSGSSSDIINLNLGLFDGEDLVSNQAETTFFSFYPRLTEDYSWYDWAVLNWQDDDGSPLDVSTLLSTFPCGDPLDMVGTTAVPIPGTGLLLSFGILCLIGRRNSQR
jgi:hypothetical protein